MHGGDMRNYSCRQRTVVDAVRHCRLGSRVQCGTKPAVTGLLYNTRENGHHGGPKQVAVANARHSVAALEPRKRKVRNSAMPHRPAIGSPLLKLVYASLFNRKLVYVITYDLRRVIRAVLQPHTLFLAARGGAQRTRRCALWILLWPRAAIMCERIDRSVCFRPDSLCGALISLR
ncbi:hypothetical protein EJ06DRAFT_120097 [Trichodelitschia bisporula]|uniref:Uncharacterized protein n=1 Tax=Trichodelitschia bisporula TaxID=703511 RepID=A0A6G1HQ81_9PEZI|nr:hypothetical protein EJ06DRAFT_120097 [Trichodelitschia bisporula]